ncbi:MAG: hypothetical protein ACFFDK_16940 [Promethearchaeota archaeon]
MEKFDCFQVYSYNHSVNMLVDKIWVKNDRVYFRVLEELSNSHKNLELKKEQDPNVYSIHINSFFTIRCKLYF